jgi:hypothetical protein
MASYISLGDIGLPLSRKTSTIASGMERFIGVTAQATSVGLVNFEQELSFDWRRS